MTNYSGNTEPPPNAERGWIVHIDGSRVKADRWWRYPVDEPPVIKARHLNDTYYQRAWIRMGWGWEADS